jgi:hypothetical protein
MITRVNKVGNDWFAYMAERVLGPFKSEGEAWKAVKREVLYGSEDH